MKKQFEIDIITGGRNRVLVLRGLASDTTFVIPCGFSDHESLLLEAEANEVLSRKARQEAESYSRRADYARIAAELISVPPQ